MRDMIAWIYQNAASLIGVGVAIVAGIALFVLSDSATFAQNLAESVANINALYAGYPSFASVNNSVAHGQVPTAMRGSGNTIVTPWNGTVTFSPDANPSRYDIAVTNVPDSQCATTGATIGSGLVSVTVNGTPFTGGTNGIDPGVLSDACGSTGTDTNSLQYVVGK